MNKSYRKIYLTIGLIASGKSTWAKKFVKENSDTYRVSRDDLRFMTSDYSYTPENEAVVDWLYRSQIKDLILYTNHNIILDEQNLDKDRREKFKDWIRSIDPSQEFEFIEKEFPITLSQAIERDSKRDFQIGEKVIKNTWRKYEIELKTMIENSKVKYPYKGDLPDCIIVDIDGTLSNSYNRRIFDFKACINDDIIAPVAKMLYIIDTYNSRINDYEDLINIIVMSGREEICREETIHWLKVNGIPFYDLFMRKEKDNRADTIIKQELFDEHIRDKYNPLFVIDDRHDVCKMWIDNGLFVFNINQDPLAENKF